MDTNKYKIQVAQFDKEKKETIKELENSYKKQYPEKDKKELTLLMADEKTEIQQKFTDNVNDLKEKLNEEFLEDKRKGLPDYPIFMAIAEDIGYDATGKSTGKGDSDLDLIKVELSKFINQINSSSL